MQKLSQVAVYSKKIADSGRLHKISYIKQEIVEHAAVEGAKAKTKFFVTIDYTLKKFVNLRVNRFYLHDINARQNKRHKKHRLKTKTLYSYELT